MTRTRRALILAALVAVIAAGMALWTGAHEPPALAQAPVVTQPPAAAAPGTPTPPTPPTGPQPPAAAPIAAAPPVPAGWLGPVMPWPTPPLDQLEKKFHRTDTPSPVPSFFATQPAIESALSKDGNTCFVRRAMYTRLRPMILQDPMAMRPIYHATPWVSSWTLESPWSDYIFHPCGFIDDPGAPFYWIDGISTGWFHTGIEALDYLFTVGVHEIYIERQRPVREKPQVGYQRTWYVVLE